MRQRMPLARSRRAATASALDDVGVEGVPVRRKRPTIRCSDSINVISSDEFEFWNRN